MKSYSSADLRSLIRPGQVHVDVYTDPEIFRLEMDRIFGRAWVYIGHESQVAEPGAFWRTRIGPRPVVLVRDKDGAINVLMNECAHRGALVIRRECGRTTEFRCGYHGWLYHLDGRLKAAPLFKGYPEPIQSGREPLRLKPAARVDNYRGFVFASLASEGPSLIEWLGNMTTSFDDMVDRAPGGELSVAGGVLRHAYDGNWKFYLENLNDTAHPLFVHTSSIEAAQAQSDDAHSDGAGEIAIRQMRQNAVSYAFKEANMGIWTYPNGHSFQGDYHDDEKLVAAYENSAFRAYVAALEQSKGAARAREILSVRRWNSNVYPNCSFMSQFRQLRVVHPVSADRTEVHAYCFRMKGAPESMFQDTVRFANVVNGTGSMVLTDDLEIYGRIQAGLASRSAEWLQIGRGYTTDVDDDHGGRRGLNSTSEIYIRNMFDTWLALMTEERAA